MAFDENFETDIEGVFAIGDVIKKDIYQLVTASSDAIHAVSNISKIVTTKLRRIQS